MTNTQYRDQKEPILRLLLIVFGASEVYGENPAEHMNKAFRSLPLGCPLQRSTMSKLLEIR